MRADLHIHTALSPCGGDEMTPPAIVAAALAARLDMVAVCDHNAAGNARAVAEAARAVGEASGARLAVVAGIEITTVEEVHVLGLFPTATAAANAADEVRELLPQADEAYGTFFGEQRLMAADGVGVGNEPRALALATSLRLDAAVALIKRYGGLAVAAHIDRPNFGVLAQLGFFPYEAGFDAVELSRHVAPGSAAEAACAEHHLPVLRSSDSHYLADVGGAATELALEAPTFAELALAVRHGQGRRVVGAARGSSAHA
jgi:hypothetical protein